MLKAQLVCRTPAGDRINLIKSLKRDFGHSLPLLQEGLRDRGVMIPLKIARDMRLAGLWSPELRYEPGPGDEREATDFIDAVRVIAEWAKGSI
jgi:hypothetical protein